MKPGRVILWSLPVFVVIVYFAIKPSVPAPLDEAAREKLRLERKEALAAAKRQEDARAQARQAEWEAEQRKPFLDAFHSLRSLGFLTRFKDKTDDEVCAAAVAEYALRLPKWDHLDPDRTPLTYRSPDRICLYLLSLDKERTFEPLRLQVDVDSGGKKIVAYGKLLKNLEEISCGKFSPRNVVETWNIKSEVLGDVGTYIGDVTVQFECNDEKVAFSSKRVDFRGSIHIDPHVMSVINPTLPAGYRFLSVCGGYDTCTLMLTDKESEALAKLSGLELKVEWELNN